MVDDKLIRVHKVGQNDPLYFFLPTTKAPTVFSHAHERSCADIYVSYETTGQLKTWNVPENFEDYESYVKAGVRPDRNIYLIPYNRGDQHGAGLTRPC